MKKSLIKSQLFVLLFFIAIINGLNAKVCNIASCVESQDNFNLERFTGNSNQIPMSTFTKAWTFDCNSQGWGDFSHSESFVATHLLADENVNSGHLEFRHKEGAKGSWLFGPLTEPVDADLYKYLHFSLSLKNAGDISAEGIPALFVWDLGGNSSQLRTKPFTIQSGQHDYTIDLSAEAEWKGNLYINRMHLPRTDQTGVGYTPESAVYKLDWVMLSDKSGYTKPVQDTTMACAPVMPVLSETMESVVFGNRASVKTSFLGGRSDAKMNVWISGGDTIVKTQTLYSVGDIYFSCFDLALNTTYNYQIELANSIGNAKSNIQQFTTGDIAPEEMPMNYWMTPSPFKLTENPNDHLFDMDNWPEAAEFAQVYKIHGATFYNVDRFYAYDLPKLFYAINKFNMRLALEIVVAGNKTGQQFANEIENYIEEFASLGGKLEFLTWDGMLLRSYATPESSTTFRAKEEGIEAEAECTRILQKKYPHLHIIPLPNLPNWDVKDANGNIISHNAGDWTSLAGVQSINDLFDIYLAKLEEKNTDIKFIEIDHPYTYYLNGRAVSAQRVKAMNDYCEANGLKLINIVNTTKDDSNYSFKQACLDYYDALVEDGNKPEYINLESWYPFPEYLTPETKENSFTNAVRDLGIKFFLIGDIIVTTQGDVSTIRGYGVSVQLFAKWRSSGSDVDVDWTIDRPDLASIDENGLLTTIKWGDIVVTATAKDGSRKFGTIELKIVDPDQPEAIKIRTQNDAIVISGIGHTLQLYAEDDITGKKAEVDWSVDNFRAATIDANGLMTSLRNGVVNVSAILKQNAQVSATVKITIDNTTGVPDLYADEQIIIYPNPANEYLYVELPDNYNDATISILDVMGKTRKFISDINHSKFKVFVGYLPKGFYFVHVKTDGRIATKKIIITG